MSTPDPAKVCADFLSLTNLARSSGSANNKFLVKLLPDSLPASNSPNLEIISLVLEPESASFLNASTALCEACEKFPSPVTLV